MICIYIGKPIVHRNGTIDNEDLVEMTNENQLLLRGLLGKLLFPIDRIPEKYLTEFKNYTLAKICNQLGLKPAQGKSEELQQRIRDYGKL